MRWSWLRRLREAGGCIDHGMVGAGPGCFVDRSQERTLQIGRRMVLDMEEAPASHPWHAGRLVDIVFHASPPVTAHRRSC